MSTDPADRDRSSESSGSSRSETIQPAVHAVVPPASNTSTKALIGILLAGTAGMIIFFVHLSKDGTIRPGPTPAHAECTKGQRDFSSVSRIVATRYEVLVEHKLAAQGRELLAQLPGHTASQQGF